MISWILAVALAAQNEPAFDIEQYVRDHQQELKAEINRQRQIKSLSDDQAMIVYDQCLARAAAQVSKTAVAESEVFGRARALCAVTRHELLSGSPPARFLAFKALDEQKSASFPALTRQIRDRRRASDFDTGSDFAPNK